MSYTEFKKIDKSGKTVLVGSKIKDSEKNIFIVKDFENNGVTLKGQAGEKEIAQYDLKFFEVV